MKARSIARELALLGISQLADTSDEARQHKTRQSASRGTARRAAHQESSQTLSANQLEALLVKALAALSADVGEALETADGELQRSERLILESETRTIEADKVRLRIEPAVPLVETAINRVGGTLEFLVFAQQGDKPRIAQAQVSLEKSANHLHRADQLLTATESRIADISEVREAIQSAIAAVKAAMTSLRQGLEPGSLKQLIDHSDIRSYATDLLDNWINHWRTVDDQLNDAMEKWSIRRLARVDRDILRLAMMEIIYMDVPKRVAIDEAIEMAKRYSDEDSYRFINGVLRRTTDKLAAPDSEAPSASTSPSPGESPAEEPVLAKTAAQTSPEQTSPEEPVSNEPVLEAPTLNEALKKEPTADGPATEAAIEEPILNEPVLDAPVPKPPLKEPPSEKPLLEEVNEAAETPSTETSSPEPISAEKAPNPSTQKRSIPAPIPKNKTSPPSENPWPSPE